MFNYSEKRHCNPQVAQNVAWDTKTVQKWDFGEISVPGGHSNGHGKTILNGTTQLEPKILKQYRFTRSFGGLNVFRQIFW